MNELRLHSILEQATRFQEEGKPLHAIQLLTGLMREDPACDRAYVQLAHLYMEMNRPELAERILLRGARMNTENLEYQFLLGNLHLKQSRFELALKYFGSLKHLNIPQIHQSIGLIYLHQENLPGAEEELRKAAVGDSDLPRVHELLGEVLFLQKKYADAEKALQFALNRNPYSSPAYKLLGKIHLENKQFKEAHDAFVQGIDCDPDDGEMWSLCGFVLTKMERYLEAKAYLERACTLSPESADVWTNLGIACLKLGDHHKARTMIEAALAIDPEHPAARQLKQQLNS